MEKLSRPDVNLILIEDSSWCNMQCDYCSYWKEHLRDQHQLLSWQDLDNIFTYAEQEPNKIEILHLYTEPLLNFDNIKKATELHHLSNINHNLYTNGLLLDTEKLNWLLANDINVTVSYDGLNQNIRCANTFDKITDLIYQHPYCFGVSATLHKFGLDDALKNAKWLSHLPICGAALKPNTIYNWTYDELKEYYCYIQDNCTQQEIQMLGLDSESLIAVGGLTPKANRKNSLFVRADGRVFQMTEAWMLTDIGPCNSFIDNIKDQSKINYYSNRLNCNECVLHDICQPYEDPFVYIRVGPGSCNYRKVLSLFVKGDKNDNTRS